MKKIVPSVSIIIPMYNAEKYVSECLDSILAQTFDDYEVIVVDDCSTDSSAAIVEGYIPKFGDDKLQLIRSKVNSGGRPGIPRNIGIRTARGEYLMFVDSDDVITETALEELYSAAKEFKSDAVHFEKFYRAPNETVSTDKSQLKEESLEHTNFVTEPALMPPELDTRIREFYEHKFVALSVNTIVRRQFIAENNIEYPALRCGEDFVFGFYVLCLAEKILRVPTVCYVWRKNAASFTWEKLSADKTVHRWIDSLFRGSEIMDKFMNRFELFNTRMEYRYMVFELTTHYHLCHVVPLYAQIPASQLEGLIRRELEGVEDKTALTAFLFAHRNVFYLKILQQQQKIQQLQSQLKQIQQAQPTQFHLNTEDIFK